MPKAMMGVEFAHQIINLDAFVFDIALGAQFRLHRDEIIDPIHLHAVAGEIK
jgi:hypothetical protein